MLLTTNEVALFEQNSIEVMRELSQLKSQLESLKKADSELRSQLQEKMTEYGITSFKNEYVTISNVAPSESISVDLKTLEKKEPECYKGLIEDYPKVTKKSGYVRITVK